MRALKIVSVAIVLAFTFAPAVDAQTSSAEAIRLSIITFSQPVQLPGVTLPAGKYRFEMENPNTTSHTVKVSRENGTNVGLFKTMSVTNDSRDLKDTDVAVMWSERAAGQPQALKEWYYPQRKDGEEFVYPRAEAIAIAAANRAPVPTEVDGRIVRIDATGNAAERSAAASTSAAATQAAQAPAAPARTSAQASVGTAGQASQAPAPAERRTLPSTASQLGLFGLMSGLSIGAAFAVRQLRLRLAARS